MMNKCAKPILAHFIPGCDIMFKKILIATDNSALMPHLIRYTAALFPDAEYHVVSVVETRAGLGQMPGLLLQHFEEMSRNAVEQAKTVLEEHGIKARGIVVRGDPAKEIVRQANDLSADLLALGSHAVTGTQAMKLCRVCMKVLENMHCNALIMSNPVDAKTPKKILNPTTDSKYSRKASATAVRLASGFRAELATLYIGTSEEACHRQALEHVEAMAAKSGVRFQGIVGGNMPEIEIIEREKNYDLMIGSRGRRGAGYRFRFIDRELALGNLEKRIIASSKIPIILTND